MYPHRRLLSYTRPLSLLLKRVVCYHYDARLFIFFIQRALSVGPCQEGSEACRQAGAVSN